MLWQRLASGTIGDSARQLRKGMPRLQLNWQSGSEGDDDLAAVHGSAGFGSLRPRCSVLYIRLSFAQGSQAHGTCRSFAGEKFCDANEWFIEASLVNH